MPTAFYPAVLYPADAKGLHGVVVPGINVNGQGKNAQAALLDAAAVLQEVIDAMRASGEPIPPPLELADVAAEDGTMVMLPATRPGRATRINVMMDEELIRRIDAVASNRSGFLARAAQAMLAAA
jgi:predicted RNase H-like HicB family nuclease